MCFGRSSDSREPQPRPQELRPIPNRGPRTAPRLTSPAASGSSYAPPQRRNQGPPPRSNQGTPPRSNQVSSQRSNQSAHSNPSYASSGPRQPSAALSISSRAESRPRVHNAGPASTGTSRTGSGSSRALSLSPSDLAKATDSMNEVTRLAAYINTRLDAQTAIIDELRAWAATLDRNTYRSEPWTPEVHNAWAAYKQLDTLLQPARAAYTNCMYSNNDMDAESFVVVTKAALHWAETALHAAEARITFMVTYRNAYRSVQDISNHITAAIAALGAARNAMRKMEASHTRVYVLLGATIRSDIFR